MSQALYIMNQCFHNSDLNVVNIWVYLLCLFLRYKNVTENLRHPCPLSHSYPPSHFPRGNSILNVKCNFKPTFLSLQIFVISGSQNNMEKCVNQCSRCKTELPHRLGCIETTVTHHPFPNPNFKILSPLSALNSSDLIQWWCLSPFVPVTSRNPRSPQHP